MGLASAASACPIVLYSKGLVNSGLSGVELDQGLYPATNSFIMPLPETIEQADLVVCTAFGPLDGATIDWKITAGPFRGPAYAGGTSTLTGTFMDFNDPQSTYLAGFDLNVPLSAGTYWLEIDGGIAPQAGDLWWDYSNGPSSAWEGGTSLHTNTSNSFEILGTPEPAGALMCGGGLLFLAGPSAGGVRCSGSQSGGHEWRRSSRWPAQSSHCLCGKMCAIPNRESMQSEAVNGSGTSRKQGISDQEFVAALRVAVEQYLHSVDRWEAAYSKYYRLPGQGVELSSDLEAEHREYSGRRRELTELLPRARRLCLRHGLREPFSGLLRINLGQYAPQERLTSAISRSERNAAMECLVDLSVACLEPAARNGGEAPESPKSWLRRLMSYFY